MFVFWSAMVSNGQQCKIHKFRRKHVSKHVSKHGEAFISFHLVSSRALMCRNIVVKSPLRGEKMQRTSRGAWGVTVTQLAVPRAAPSSAALGSHLLGNVGNVGKCWECWECWE